MVSSLEALRAEVLGTDSCTACGACVGLCPYILAIDDNVAAVGGCRIDGGRCYRYCPRTGGDTAAPGGDATAPGGDAPGSVRGAPDLSGAPGLAGDAGFAGPIGLVRTAYVARAVETASPGRPAQHGGTVSALLRQALRDGSVRTAVLTEDVGLGSPRARLAETEAGIDACRGSKFAVAPVAAAANRALAEGRAAVGVVALPCQATALAGMRAAGDDVPVLPGGVTPAAGVSLVIGLFCTWALEQEGWARLSGERLGPGPFRRVDIPPPPAEVLVAEGADGSLAEVPLAEVRALVRPGCRVCTDMTAENADVSVGMAETEPGWNTLLVRSEAGERLVARAVAAGALEVRPASPEGMAHLESASLGKKRRAAAEAGARIAARASSEPDAGPQSDAARRPGAAPKPVSPFLARVASWEDPR